MPALSDQALVLRVWEYSETSQTVSLFSHLHGLLRGIVKGAFRPGSRFGGGLEPLTRGEVLFIAKPTGELTTITEWDLQEVFWGPRRSLGSHRAGLYIADLVHHSILDRDPHPGLFAVIVESLRSLASPHAGPRTLLRFQWRLLAEIGYRPKVESAGSNGRSTLLFSPLQGGLIDDAESDSHAWRVRPQTVQALHRLAHDDSTPEDSPADIERAGRLLSEYLRYLLAKDLPSREVVYGPLQSSPAEGGQV